MKAERSELTLVVLDEEGRLDPSLRWLEGVDERLVVSTSRPEPGGWVESLDEAIRDARGELVLVVRSGSALGALAVCHVREAFECSPRLALVGAKVLVGNARVRDAGWVFGVDGRPRPAYAGFSPSHPAVNVDGPVGAVDLVGAAVRRRVFTELGGLDADLGSSGAGLDFCRRVVAAGGEVRYLPSVVIVDGRPQPNTGSLEAFCARWAGRLPVDELARYERDGLVGLTSSTPRRLFVVPEIADAEHRAEDVDRLLELRACQVDELARERDELARSVESGSPARRPDPRPLVLGTGIRHAARSPARDARRLLSVVLPVCNDEAALRERLPELVDGWREDDLEIVAVDGGSTDASVELLREAGATVLSGERPELPRAHALRVGAARARGELLILLDPRVVPSMPDWIPLLVRALDDDAGLVGASSRILPGPDADPPHRRDCLARPTSSELRAEVASAEGVHLRASVVRASVLRFVPIPDVPADEGRHFGHALLERGLRWLHEPRVVVCVEDRATPWERLSAGIAGGRADRIGGHPLGAREVLPSIFREVLEDWRAIDSGDVSEGLVESWKILAAVRRTLDSIGRHVGASNVGEELARALAAAEREAPPVDDASGPAVRVGRRSE